MKWYGGRKDGRGQNVFHLLSWLSNKWPVAPNMTERLLPRLYLDISRQTVRILPKTSASGAPLWLAVLSSPIDCRCGAESRGGTISKHSRSCVMSGAHTYWGSQLVSPIKLEERDWDSGIDLITLVSNHTNANVIDIWIDLRTILLYLWDWMVFFFFNVTKWLLQLMMIHKAYGRTKHRIIIILPA